MVVNDASLDRSHLDELPVGADGFEVYQPIRYADRVSLGERCSVEVLDAEVSSVTLTLTAHKQHFGPQFEMHGPAGKCAHPNSWTLNVLEHGDRYVEAF